MLAHRNQENMVYGHQGTVKHQPKTPGARFPKTPGQNDENAATVLVGKTGLNNGKLTQKNLVTPSETRARAPLGNKTTNAKARTNQVLGGKETTKKVEKSQSKPTTIQKQSQKQLTSLSTKLAVKCDENELSEEEPEYAPPRPKALPYESDVLPKGGLTVHGLKKENLLRGYYQHFHNPVDENGISRQDKQFAEEMKRVLDQADERNQHQIDALDWGITDEIKPAVPLAKKRLQPQGSKATMAKTTVRGSQRNPPATVVSRRAASALSMSSDREKAPLTRNVPASGATRKPLSSMLRTAKPQSQAVSTRPHSTGLGGGDVVSRTTLGYNKGRAVSSLVHPTKTEAPSKPAGTAQLDDSLDSFSELTITPARMRQSSPLRPEIGEGRPIPSFVSMFDDDDEEELPGIKIPQDLLDDGDEEFEFK